jgi:hypothetical protein
MSNYMTAYDLQQTRKEYLDSIRSVMAPQYRGISDAQVAETLRNTLGNMSPAEQEAFAVYSLQNAQENFFSDLGRGLSGIVQGAGQFFNNAGRQIAKAAPGIIQTVAPIAQAALPIVGTLIGGPAGTAIGGALGGLLGNLTGNNNTSSAQQQTQSPVPTLTGQAAQFATQPTQPLSPAVSNPANNPAATQMMALLNNPALIQALLGQVLGRAGNGTPTVQTANQPMPIPFAALMNTVSELAERAAKESIIAGSYESESYLVNTNGQYRVSDPSSREQRADAVLELLNEDYYYRKSTSSAQAEQNTDAIEYDQVSEWLISAGMIK